MRGVQVRLGMEASGQARWFERLLAELQMELWIGDAAEMPRILAISLLLAYSLRSDGMAVVQLERNGALSGVHGSVRPKPID